VHACVYVPARDELLKHLMEEKANMLQNSPHAGWKVAIADDFLSDEEEAV